MNEESKEIDKKVKSFLASKTIWGIIIAAAPMISKLIGIDVVETVTDLYGPIIEIIGMSWAIYGRFKAKGGIKLRK